MAYAAFPHATFTARQLRVAPVVVIDIVADTCEAAHVRHAVSDCTGSGVLRCIPLQHDGRVRLQVRCPACEVQHLMHEVMSRTLAAEFGRTLSWKEHMERFDRSRV